MLETDMAIWSHWLNMISALLPRLFVLIIAAFVSIRFKCLRRSIQRAETEWWYRLVMICAFGCFAFIGTHTSVPIDLHGNWQLTDNVPKTLKESQALVGFRDAMTLSAGLVGGWWVGLGAGLLAGIDRFALGGIAASSSSLATLVLGIFAGTVRQFKPQWTQSVWSIFGVALVGTVIQRIIILLMIPAADAWLLAREIGIPVAVVNISGCILFFLVMRDLDRDRLENEAREARLLALQAQVERDRQEQLAQKSELRALRAQIDPHFLNNTLNDLKALVRQDPETARRYIVELAGFFNNTRDFAARNTISLDQEVAQLQRYLTLQRLGLADKLHANIDIPLHLGIMQVLPSCLITLVENALKHAFKGRTAPYRVNINATETEAELILSVQDNGIGISSARLAELGKKPVSPASKGGGVALYQLQQSLALEFGEQARLACQSNPNNGTSVRLILPKRSTA